MPVSASDPVARYYDSMVAQEWARLEHSWIEYAVTMEFLTKYIPKRSEVLDIGGGPGRYAIALSALGHLVDLRDISAQSIAFAEHVARERGVIIRSAHVGDATEIVGSQDAAYDAVLCLGPLYHIVDDALRKSCYAEVRRVLKPGGVAFFAFLSVLAPLHFTVKKGLALTPEWSAFLTEIGTCDNFIMRDGDTPPFFTQAYFVSPVTVARSVRQAHFDVVATFGAESTFAQTETVLSDRSDAERTTWKEIAVKLSTTSAALQCSEHIVCVAHKPATPATKNRR
ncbi:MAG: class I SAM-dependent methyltransferase [Hyphomicrobiaceae bacterium]